ERPGGPILDVIRLASAFWCRSCGPLNFIWQPIYPDLTVGAISCRPSGPCFGRRLHFQRMIAPVILVTFRAIMSRARCHSPRRRVTSRATLHACNHYLLCITRRGRSRGWIDELGLVAFGIGVCRLMALAAVHMPVPPVIEPRVPQPDTRNI